MLISLSSEFGLETHQWAWAIGTAFAFPALIISSWLCIKTWFTIQQPRLRNSVTLVLMMVPIYTVCAWLGLVIKEGIVYFDLLRATYEAIALAAFYELVVDLCGGRQHTHFILSLKDPVKPLFPFCCLPAWNMHNTFYVWTRRLVLQYPIVQIACAIVTFVTSFTGQYTDGAFNKNDAYPYLSLVVNCSQIAALYALVDLYRALHYELLPANPLYKFMCIKLVVFFTFWQSIVISGFVAGGVLAGSTTYSVDQQALSINDFVLCVEMLLLAFFHIYAFPVHEFDEHYKPNTRALAVSQEEADSTNIYASVIDTWVLSERAKMHITDKLDAEQMRAEEKAAAAAKLDKRNGKSDTEMVTIDVASKASYSYEDVHQPTTAAVGNGTAQSSSAESEHDGVQSLCTIKPQVEVPASTMDDHRKHSTSQHDHHEQLAAHKSEPPFSPQQMQTDFASQSDFSSPLPDSSSSPAIFVTSSSPLDSQSSPESDDNSSSASSSD